MSLSVKNILGGGKPEGLYAWKKYEEIGTYRYSLKSSIVTCVVGKSADKFTITLDSSNYDGDLSYLDVKNLCKWLDGSLGIVRNSKRQICSWNGGDYLTFADHDDSSVTRYVYPSINNNIVTVTLYAFEDKSYTWNGLTKNTSFSSSIENAFEYYDYDYEYKGYIVSDKETAYPDGGEKGGYWYEKVVAGAKTAFGSVSISNSPSDLVINHNLGVMPTKAWGFAMKGGSYSTAFYVDGTSAYVRYGTAHYNRDATVDASNISIPSGGGGTWVNAIHHWVVIAE